jgi:putative salt-induced outer membrane protein YdiY
LLALLVAVTMTAGSIAAEEKEDWTPEPPMPDEWDWVQMTSGEWLKGEIKVLYRDSLEFDSDEFDLLSLDWDDVQQVRSGRPMQVRFTDGTTAVGKILYDGKTVRVLGEDWKDLEFAHDQVLTIIAGEPKEVNYWSGKVSLGFNVRRGNSKVSEYNAKLNFKRRTVKTRLTLDYIGNYNNTEDEEVANNHRASAGWDIFITDRMYVQAVFGEYFRDPFQNVADRYTVGAGIGYTLVDTTKITWEIVGGPAYQYTEFASVEPDADDFNATPALVAATIYDHELTGWMDFLFEYRFQFVNEESGQYNHHMVTGFETEITSLLDFDVTFVWDRIEKPRPDEDGLVPFQDDVRLIVGLGLDW